MTDHRPDRSQAMTTTREASYQEYINEKTPNGNSRLDNIILALCADAKRERHVATQIDMAFQAGWSAALSTPATEPQGLVEGPQFRALKTCTGCAHFKSEYWREPSGDGETYDSGTSADCLKAGRSISTYHGSEPAPPDWCPLAARPAPQPTAEHEYPDPLIAEDRYEDDQPAADTRDADFVAEIAKGPPLGLSFMGWTNAMTLKARAIIGTATPAPSDKLDPEYGHHLYEEKTFGYQRGKP